MINDNVHDFDRIYWRLVSVFNVSINKWYLDHTFLLIWQILFIKAAGLCDFQQDRELFRGNREFIDFDP